LFAPNDKKVAAIKPPLAAAVNFALIKQSFDCAAASGIKSEMEHTVFLCLLISPHGLPVLMKWCHNSTDKGGGFISRQKVINRRQIALNFGN
jgi:hypothetical protein